MIGRSGSSTKVLLWRLTRGDSGEVRIITSGLSEDRASERGVLAMRRLAEGEADSGVICAADLPDIFDEEVVSVPAVIVDVVLRWLLPRILRAIIS